MTQKIAQAKTLILDWFDKSDQPAKLRGKLSSNIDRFFEEIAERNSWSECMTVLLANSTAARFSASGRDWLVVPSTRGLTVSTVVPGWGFGWNKIFRDEYVYRTLSWLGHYARQYIHRSQVAKVLMIAWERDKAVLHPFGSQFHIQRYGPMNTPKSSAHALSIALKSGVTEFGEIQNATRSRSRWVRRNTLEPAIHQAIFHFLRGQTLLSAGCGIEALVAFDCVLQSLQAMRWKSPVGDPMRNRSDLVATLSLTQKDQELAEQIYFLRNEFGAHAGGWRWWDITEYVDDEFMDRASGIALRVLQRAGDKEPAGRRIEAEPDNWSAWLIDSFPVLFSAIWFPARSSGHTAGPAA